MLRQHSSKLVRGLRGGFLVRRRHFFADALYVSARHSQPIKKICLSMAENTQARCMRQSVKSLYATQCRRMKFQKAHICHLANMCGFR